MNLRSVFLVLLVVTGVAVSVAYAEQARYIGAKTCGECHPQEYERFVEFSKKSGSFESIKVMKPKLTREEYQVCFECHTTGYKEPGGFVSESETPELRNAGCEVCHGPGSIHADTGGDPAEIRHDLSLEDCKSCHNSERVNAFDFKPLLFGGAH
ncbi:MAG: cytochrome c family protein [Desulfarculaceae bacterium]|nr:cytochrome c family protein [Desulfarculaceae bacterium]